MLDLITQSERRERASSKKAAGLIATLFALL